MIQKEESILFSKDKNYSLKINTLTNVYLFCLKYENFINFLNRINIDEDKKLLVFLKHLSLFDYLEESIIEKIAKVTRLIELKESEILDQKDENLYILKFGLISEYNDEINETLNPTNTEVLNLSKFIFSLRNNISYKAINHVQILFINKIDLRLILGFNFLNEMMKNYLSKLIIKNKEDKYLSEIIDINKTYLCFTLKQYSKGKKIFSSKANVSKKIIIVLYGHLVNSTTKELIAKKNDLYGLHEINKKENTDYDIIADSTVINLEVKWENILQRLNSNPKIAIEKYNLLQSLSKNSFFSYLEEYKLSIIASKMQYISVKSNSTIFKEKEISEYLFYLSNGSVDLNLNKNKIKVVNSNSFLDLSIFLNNYVNTYSAVAKKESEIYFISKKELFEILDENEKELLSEKAIIYNTDIKLNLLKIIKILGKGTFGQVFLVTDDKYFYAMKCIKKSSVLNFNNRKSHIIKEQMIMDYLDHAFTVKLINTYETKKHIMFLMENVEGITMGEFLQIRKENYYFNNILTSFYAANLILVLNYFKEKQLAHRDIKPDNMIIRLNGYIKIIDFGGSKKIKDYAKTILGTPHYIAPEIIQGNAYDLSVDYWSLGITIHEIFYGHFPYGNEANNPEEVYHELLTR